MNDEPRTKKQLIEELKDLQDKLTDMERRGTEHNKTEKALRLTQYALDHAPDAVYWMDPKGRFLYVNEVACRTLGYSREELLSMGVEDIDPNVPKGVPPEMAQATKEMGFGRVETEHRTKDGRTLPVEVMVRCIEFEGKEYHCSFARDITECKKVEEELKLQGEIISTMAEGAHVVRITDATIIYANPTFENMFGYKPGGLIGKNVSTLNDPDDKNQENIVNDVLEDLRTKGQWEGEVRNVKKDGTKLCCYATVSTFNHPQHGNLAVTVQTDITDRKRTQDELLRAHEELEVRVEERTAELASANRVLNEEIKERKQMEDALKAQNERRDALSIILTIIQQNIPFEVQLKKILEALFSNTWLQVLRKGAIFTVEKGSGELSLAVHHGFNDAVLASCSRVPFGKCLCGRAAASGETIFSDSLDERHEITYDGIETHGHYCVPIMAEKEVLGVINLYVNEGYRRERYEEEFLMAVANAMASLIERRRAEEGLKQKSRELKTLTEDLRGLSARLSKEGELSRRRLARVLHEQIGQNLAVFSMNFDDIADGVIAGDGNIRDTIGNLTILLEETIKSTRELTADLYPTILDDLGFLPALTWYKELVLDPLKIAVFMDIDSSVEYLSTDYKVSLFRIAQEAIQNISKHARATEVEVTFNIDGRSMELCIKDNGVGFDLKEMKARKDKGIGLMLLQERSLTLGGSLTIGSAPGKGTELSVELPMRH